MRPTILIADDHQLFAESLRSLLSPTYDVVGSYQWAGTHRTGYAVQARPDGHRSFDAILNGLDAVQNLTAMGLRSKFVVLTMHAI